MTEADLANFKHIIGLDIGDGESTLAWMDTENLESIRPYQRQETGEVSIVTALARDPATSEQLIGDAALRAEGASQFMVNFKGRPPHELNGRDVGSFAELLLREFFADHQEAREGCALFIGHPAGWPDAAIENYYHYLRQPGLPTFLLAESQSALLHVRGLGNAGPKPSDQVLVVDIGSSTIDFTYVNNLKVYNLELGYNFGCQEIDKELEARTEERFDGRPEFKSALGRDGARALLKLICRYIKEEQFGGPEFHPLEIHWAAKEQYAPIVDSAANWLRSQEIEREVVRRPGGWAEQLQNLLEEAKQCLDSNNLLAETIIITGGGSRMGFLQGLCRRVFPDSALEMDSEPSTSVARGLAYAGYHRVRTARFRRDMDATVNSNETRQFVLQRTEAAFAESKELIAITMDRYKLQAWNSVIPRLPGREQVLKDLEEALDNYLTPITRRVCERYGIDSSRFEINLTLPSFFADEFIDQVLRQADYQRIVSRGVTVAVAVPLVIKWLRPHRRDDEPPSHIERLAETAETWIVGTGIYESTIEWRRRNLAKNAVLAAQLPSGAAAEILERVLPQLRQQVDERAYAVEKFVT